MRYVFMRYPGGKAKAVTFSYDDGCTQDIRLAGIFTRYGMKATFNLNGDDHKKGRGLSQTDVEEHILSKGHEVAVHGYYHRAEGALRPIEGIRDVLDCRLELEKKFNRIIRGMAYPDTGVNYFANGAEYEKIKAYLTELDIVYSRIVRGDNNSFLLPTDWHRWMPTASHANPEIMTYIEEFLNYDLSPKSYCASRAPRLFYIWGHSYQFDDDNNWDLIETICQTFKDNEDDLWFATNMEIYDYVTAYNSLVYSAEGKTVYNPTLMTIWFDVDGALYTIGSGETIHL